MSLACVPGAFSRLLVSFALLLVLLPGAGWAQSLVPPFYEITVTPDNGTAPLRAPNSGPHVASLRRPDISSAIVGPTIQ